MINKISIIGGDLRIVKLAEMLLEEGVEVFTYALEKSEETYYKDFENEAFADKIQVDIEKDKWNYEH